MGRTRQGAPLLVATLSAVTLAAASRARADELPRARLVYTAADAGPTCPDERALRQRVATRLGVDPFVAEGDLAFQVAIVARGGRYTATIVVSDHGGPRSSRTLDDAACPALVDSVASTIALTIDPIGTPRKSPTGDATARPEHPRDDDAAPPPSLPALPPPPEREGPLDAARPREAPRPPRPAPKGLDISPTATLDVTAHVGLAPNPTFGARLGLGLASKRLSVHAEGSAEATAAAGGARDEVVGQVFAAHIVPCLSVTGPWLVCAAIDLGVVRARARLGTLPDYAVDPIVGLGARAGLRLPIGRVWAFRVQLEGGGLAMRAAYIVDGRRAASTGPVFFGLAFGLEARAP